LLELEFSDGRIIAYKGVSAKIYRQLMSSPSPAQNFGNRPQIRTSLIFPADWR